MNKAKSVLFVICALVVVTAGIVLSSTGCQVAIEKERTAQERAQAAQLEALARQTEAIVEPQIIRSEADAEIDLFLARAGEARDQAVLDAFLELTLEPVRRRQSWRFLFQVILPVSLFVIGMIGLQALGSDAIKTLREYVGACARQEGTRAFECKTTSQDRGIRRSAGVSVTFHTSSGPELWGVETDDDTQELHIPGLERI